jgi:hypothetical protein
MRFWSGFPIYEFRGTAKKMNRYLLYILRPFVEVFLWSLDKLFKLTRKRVEPTYPYDKQTQRIQLPNAIANEIYQLALKEAKPKAVKKVAELTGAGLRVSKDYVDELLRQRETGYKAKGAKQF